MKPFEHEARQILVSRGHNADVASRLVEAIRQALAAAHRRGFKEAKQESLDRFIDAANSICALEYKEPKP